MYKRNIFSIQPLLPRKTVSITYFECILVAYAKLSCVAYPVLKYFSTLSHKWHDFRQGYYCTQNVLQLLSEVFLILRITEQDMIMNVYWSSCKVPISLIAIQRLEFSLVDFRSRCKIVVDNQCLQQVKSFKYLGCEISYKSEQDIEQKLPNFSLVLGILNNIFNPTLVQKFSRKKYIIWKKNLGPQKKGLTTDINRD